MKTTRYFKFMKTRPDRSGIEEKWIMSTIRHPERKETRKDGRTRMWAKIKEAGDKYLRVIFLDDGETVHNAFFDRNFKEG